MCSLKDRTGKKWELNPVPGKLHSTFFREQKVKSGLNRKIRPAVPKV
jgi:hypothetical protein